MTNLDSILKSRDITLPTKVRLVKATVFPGVIYGCENWTVKKAEHRRIDTFELWCWRRLLRVPWTARRSKVSVLQHSAFFMVQLSHLYMTTGKTIAVTRRTFVGKVMSLLFNMLSRLVMYGCESWTVKKAEHRRIDALNVVLEKTLESPLDCKEIQPVHSKGDQSWVFFGRNDAKTETPVGTLATSCRS